MCVCMYVCMYDSNSALFSQAAKLNPFNPDVFLHIGHYQKVVTKDLKWALPPLSFV